MSLNIQNHKENVYGNTQEHSMQHLSGISPRTPGKTDDRLQYLDLDHSNSSQKSFNHHHHHHHGGIGSGQSAGSHQIGSNGMGGSSSLVPPPVARTPYTTVDFVKTDALNRIREDSEANRKLKD